MITKLIKGRGLKGVAMYVLHDKRDVPKAPSIEADAPPAFPMHEADPTRAVGRYDALRESEALARQLDYERGQTSERVGFVTTRNLSTDDPHIAWRLMCQTALLQDELRKMAGIRAGGRKTENHVAHLSLSWHPDENPDQKEMERAADSVLKAMGYDHLETIIVEHTDEAHKHVHLIVCMIDPATGRAAPNRHNEIKNILEPWGLAYERERGRILCDKRLENEAARDAGQKGGLYPNKTHRKDWEHGRRIDEAFADAAQREANDNNKDRRAPQSLTDRQKAERDALYHQAKAEAKDLTAKVREAFKPQWAELYRDHKLETHELKSILKGRDRGPALARFVNEHRDTLLKAFKGIEDANKQWPDLVKGKGLAQTLAAGQSVEKAELSGRHNGVRQDAQKRFWVRYGAAIETVRTQQAYERTEAKEIARAQAAQQANAPRDPQMLEYASRAERIAAFKDEQTRAATAQAAQRMAEHAQQTAADAAKALAEAKAQEARRAKEEAERVENERAKSKGAPSDDPFKMKVQVRFQVGPQPSPHPSFVASPAADLRQRAIFKPAQAAQEPKPERPEDIQKRLDAAKLKAAIDETNRQLAAYAARRQSRGRERER